jgi:hypothetical protein
MAVHACQSVHCYLTYFLAKAQESKHNMVGNHFEHPERIPRGMARRVKYKRPPRGTYFIKKAARYQSF